MPPWGAEPLCARASPSGLPSAAFKEKHRAIEMKIETEPRETHMENFLRCVRERKTPVLDADTAYRAMVPIGMAVRSYREGRVLYFDEAEQKVVNAPPKA